MLMCLICISHCDDIQLADSQLHSLTLPPQELKYSKLCTVQDSTTESRSIYLKIN